MRYVYPCNLIPDEEEGRGFIVRFPDVPEALTGAVTREESLVLAEDALSGALAGYVHARWDIPVPSPVLDGQEAVAVRPVVAAKLELYSTMRRHRVTRKALAKHLGISDSVAGRIVDPDHRSHISQVERALRAVGRGLAIEGRAISVRDADKVLPRQQRRVA